MFVDTAGGWEQTAELRGADSAANDQFGTSVALSATTVAVSAPSHSDTSGARANGAVYVFTQTARGWTQQDELVANVNTYGAGTLGDYLAVSGRSLVVVPPVGTWASPSCLVNRGSAGSGPGKLAVPGIGDDFAGPVAITGGRAVVGYGTIGAGAFLFAQTATGWRLAGVLNEPKGTYVASVAMTDRNAIVADMAGVFVYNI